MMLWEKQAGEKLMRGRKSVPLTVRVADVSWIDPKNEKHKWWVLLAYVGNEQPNWYYTDDESLTRPGTHLVELYRNRFMKLSARKVQKG
jgi:hypothetical protein